MNLSAVKWAQSVSESTERKLVSFVSQIITRELCSRDAIQMSVVDVVFNTTRSVSPRNTINTCKLVNQGRSQKFVLGV